MNCDACVTSAEIPCMLTMHLGKIPSSPALLMNAWTSSVFDYMAYKRPSGVSKLFFGSLVPCPFASKNSCSLLWLTVWNICHSSEMIGDHLTQTCGLHLSVYMFPRPQILSVIV